MTNEELGIEPYGFNYDWNNDQDESMEQEGTSPNQTGIRIGTQFGNQTPAPDCVIPTTKKHVDLSAVESRIGTLEKNLKDLEGFVKNKSHSDNLVLAYFINWPPFVSL